jgi:hypothetical protein
LSYLEFGVWHLVFGEACRYFLLVSRNILSSYLFSAIALVIGSVPDIFWLFGSNSLTKY